MTPEFVNTANPLLSFQYSHFSSTKFFIITLYRGNFQHTTEHKSCHRFTVTFR